MSTQRGNTQRTRPQKYQNQHVFKNDLHDKSKKTKTINSLQISNVCEKCKNILEWKIKYKKFKPLKAFAICAKCKQKNVKHAYHMMCESCSKERNVCPKCGVEAELVLNGNPTREEQIKLDAELQLMLSELSERKRRTFIRYINQKGKKTSLTKEPTENNTKIDEKSEISGELMSEETEIYMRKDLLEKLKLLSTKEESNKFNSDLGVDDEDSDSLETD